MRRNEIGSMVEALSAEVKKLTTRIGKLEKASKPSKKKSSTKKTKGKGSQ